MNPENFDQPTFAEILQGYEAEVARLTSELEKAQRDVESYRHAAIVAEQGVVILEDTNARLTAELAEARGALQWIADNTGRDTWLSQFERRFNRGDVDDLMAAIDAARRAGGEG